MQNQKGNWINPFSVDRVEDWRVEEQPENYEKIAALFASPYFMNKLEDSSITKAIFIIGGRGSGKSHILKRMAIQSEIKYLEKKYNRKLEVPDFEKEYLGVYIKTDCFSPLSKETVSYLDDKQLGALFEHLFNIEVSKAIIEGIRFVGTYFGKDSFTNESTICKKIDSYLQSLGWYGGPISSYSDLLKSLDGQSNSIVKLIKNVLFDNDIGKYLNNIYITQTPDFIVRLYSIILNNISFLKNKSLILLLDEYESLDKNQQRIINQIIKGRKLTLRIAVKVRGIKTLDTKTSEKLDELHDYEYIDLHFKLDKNGRKKYKLLSKQIFENRLSLKGVFGDYHEKNPEILLPSPTLQDEGIKKDDIEIELSKIKESLKGNKELKDPEKYWKNFRGHYKEAAIFRILREKGKDKLYAGFDEYVSLSSGIIRLFIWLCREAFMIAYQEKVDILNGKFINVFLQSRAASNTAKNELDITIPQSINNIYASKLATFIFDIGQILRARLHYSSQPQANRIEIVDYEKFELKEYEIPRELIESGKELPVLLSEISFKPRDIKYPFPKTFALNGIFAPLLSIPTEGSWRTEIKSEEIKDLCLTEKRAETLTKIVNQIKGKKRKIRDKKKSNKKGIDNLELFTKKPKAITLENCPVTGKGCDKNLLYYGVSSESGLNAFLAIPFDEGWISDPRRWLKNALIEHNIKCKDIGDFPDLG